MDLHTVTKVHCPANADEIKGWEVGSAWLAGGTWLFSEPQPQTCTLIDIESFRWPALTATAEGLEIAATCKVVELDDFVASAEWIAARLFRECCRSFLASFKIWNEATVGGNIVMSLPAGPMISLAAALEGVCTLWPRQAPPRHMSVMDFVTGNHQNVLEPGELLRSIFLPASALRKRCAFRRFALTHLGRSEALVIGTRCPETDGFLLTITAATLRPIQLRFEGQPSAEAVQSTLGAAVSDDLYLDDTHGSPSHRKRLTHYFAEQIRAELQG